MCVEREKDEKCKAYRCSFYSHVLGETPLRHHTYETPYLHVE